MTSAQNRNSGKIAIVGMSCLFPGAPDLASFWSNIVRGVDSIRDVTEDEWKLDDFYDRDAKKFGLTYSKRGGFITEIADFDPLKYGVMPTGIAGGDPDQFLTLRVAYEAMADAGYLDKPLNKDRAEIILGRISAPGAGSMNLIHQSKTVVEVSNLLHNLLPDQSDVVEAAISEIKDRLITCNSDTIPSVMPNVLAGRIAAKLGFRGRNLLIDAACASSMVAVETAVQDLLTGQCDFALAGGLHVNSSPVFFQMFCGLGALSRTDVIRPFDEDADGTLLGEGIGIICLKRHEDALADGDRIYATICGVASSSDGHGGSVISPSLEGEALAMEKAYKMSGVSPRSVALLEAHGTGTPTGDITELQAVEKVFRADAKGFEPWCAIGSVKSMIGHCQSASAIAGIIKTALALHHKILPPTLNVNQPSRKIDWEKHPCYINTQARPWIHAENAENARRAAVSAFGFGGINAHMVLEEAEKGSSLSRHKVAIKKTVAPTASLSSLNTDLMRVWDSEVFTFTATGSAELVSELRGLEAFLRANEGNDVADGFLKDLAYSINCRPNGGIANSESRVSISERPESAESGDDDRGASSGHKLALVAANKQELLARIEHAINVLESAKPASHEPEKGVYYTSPNTANGGKLAFLYPGLGSGYTGMLSDLCLHFPEVREVFDIVDTVARSENADSLPSALIFPPKFSSKLAASAEALASADFAVVAILLAEYALHQLLLHLEIKPDALMGCSTGEFAAITTGGAVDVLSVAETFYGLSTKVARAIPAEALAELRSLRILAPAKEVMALVENNDVHLSADLGERHIIVTGTITGIDSLTEKLAKRKFVSQILPIAIPYHTPLVKDLIDENHDAVKSVDIQPLKVPSWACSTGERYPDDEKVLRTIFTDLFTKTVKLRETIQSMYANGVRNFIEVGPNGVLTSVVDSILGDKQYIAVPMNLSSRPALTQLHHVLAALFSQGISANFEYLYIRRAPKLIDWKVDKTVAARAVPKLSLIHAPLEVSTVAAVTQPSAPVHPSVAGLPVSAQLVPPQQAVPSPLVPALQVPTQPGAASVAAVAQSAVAERAELGSDIAEYETDSDVLGSFMNTNATFYSRMAEAQQRIMSAFLQNGSVETEPGFDNKPAFLNRFIAYAQPGVTTCVLNVDLATDLYLLDHAVGGQISVIPPARAYLMPLMVSLEIMAEAAFLHAQSGVIVRLEQVKAFKRIAVDHQGVQLHMVATGGPSKVHVEMFEAPDMANAILKADFVFDTTYPLDGRAPEIKISGEKPENLISREQLYAFPNMFHGPRMQSVISLDVVGNKCIAGKAESHEAFDWMPHLPVGKFLLHPLLLDNASQFVLFYLYEKRMPSIALLPFFVESIEFFASLEELPPVVSGRASLLSISDKATEARVEVVDQNNRVWMRVNGINSKRVMPHEKLVSFIHDPLNSYLSRQIPVVSELSGKCVLTETVPGLLSDDEAILDWTLDYLLTRNERAFWRDNLKFEKRKTDWLQGRIAAKDAIRALVAQKLNRRIGMLDIEIINDAAQRPFAIVSGGIENVLISISHTSGVAVALACFESDGRPGVDAELISARDADFAARFLKSPELKYLEECSPASRDSELIRFWSAKETLYKSFLGALDMVSFSVEIPAVTTTSMTLSNPSSATTYRVYSEVAGDHVRSYTLV